MATTSKQNETGIIIPKNHELVDGVLLSFRSITFRLMWDFIREYWAGRSECLRKAWLNHRVKRALRNGKCEFIFQKVDGSIRHAYGTLHPSLIGEVKGGNRKDNNLFQVYYDIEKKGWRCFKKFHLLELVREY